ncbi:hypothetical protein GA707_04680 [Nostocoides sp. F2B08]|uniref:hypothetical protein n=1 Tax=Nostocoides sp. F2B08 TaxID=2653936 RepID=UPI001262E8B9|nr:hypothetical protein [Tetrasphaera sp. F2B08]KAB7745247.1 hypothetical protein GA707_04680 [Tetrasphaera sp. F2B08]
MTGIDVCIWAEGNLPEGEEQEIADLGMRSHVDHVVLEGAVADQAALMGVLERLHRAGMTIREFGPAGHRPEYPRHARLSVVGQVGDLLGTVLHGALVTEEPATTTAEIDLTSDDDVFDLLRRIETLGLDIRALRIGRSPGGIEHGEHRHLG